MFESHELKEYRAIETYLDSEGWINIGETDDGDAHSFEHPTHLDEYIDVAYSDGTWTHLILHWRANDREILEQQEGLVSLKEYLKHPKRAERLPDTGGRSRNAARRDAP